MTEKMDNIQQGDRPEGERVMKDTGPEETYRRARNTQLS